MPIYLKACGRCRGDVYCAADIYGQYFDCIQCGNHSEKVVVTKVPRNHNEPVSIDANIEVLWLFSRDSQLDASKGNPALSRTLEKRLSEMLPYGYVSENGNRQEVMKAGYKLTPKGKDVADAYRAFIREIGIATKRIKDKSIITSYEIVDEDEKLTVIGRYAIKVSKVLLEFVEAMYPMATISLERPEAVRKKRGSRRDFAASSKKS